MLEPVDRFRRGSTFFGFTEKRLRDFIDPGHLLINIDERLGFSKLVALLERRYCRDHGRPASHPVVMVWALLVCSLYNIASFRRLCSTTPPPATSFSVPAGRDLQRYSTD